MSFSQLNDQDRGLLEGVAAGERRAFEALYFSYFSRLSRFLSRFGQSRETVEEIVNDTFMVVWRRAGDFRGASCVSTWIIGIAYRIALSSMRRHARFRSDEAATEEPSIDPAKYVEMQDWLSQGLAQLPLEQRVVLELAYRLDLAVDEIAVITGVPAGTVKTRMHLARQKLRAYLPQLAGVECAKGADSGADGDTRAQRAV